MGAWLSRRLEAPRVFTHTPPDVARTQKVVLDAEAIERSIRRIAVAILEATSGIEDLALIGIRRGGVVASEPNRSRRIRWWRMARPEPIATKPISTVATPQTGTAP